MALATRSSVQSFGTFQEHQNYHNRHFSSLSFTTATASESPTPYEQSTISRRESVATMESTGHQQIISTYNPLSRPASMGLPSRSNTNNINSRVGQSAGGSVDLRKQAAQKLAQKQQQLRQQQKQKLKDHQRKSGLPLFPTQRTRGAKGSGTLQPVDITKIDLIPIEVSRAIIIKCIDEIKLRGLKHKYLFRNAFYSPSVEASLRLLKNPKKRHLFSVKALRVDTVGGLLTTVLSRTYPPLIPPDIHEKFQKPNGSFFFELLGLLPELNRYLFVEILDLCCELADGQSENHVSHSKLAIYPGSCCFGLEEYMPTWDTRYLMTPDLKKFSEVFYNVIYAYREERDLSAEDLQKKVELREKVMAEERLEMLEREHGLEGAQIILRMEARVAQGLPAESPPLPVVPTSPSDLKEVSLYAGRKEKVVADDAISVLEMEIDQNENTNNNNANGSATDVSRDGRTQDSGTEDDGDEEEDVEKVMADLRRSVSVATLGYWSENNSRSTSSLSATTTASAASSTSTIALPQQHSYTRHANTTVNAPTKTAAAAATRPRLAHTKSLARFGSIAQNQFPVSPGDIFGISRHAIEQRELQQFLSVARTFKRRKSFGTKNGGNTGSKRISQWRLQNKRLRPLSPSRSPAFGATHLAAGSAPLFVLRRTPRQHNAVLLLAANSSSSRSREVSTDSLPTTSPTPVLVSATKSRRGRTRQFRKELEVYLSQGLTQEEAIQQRRQDKRRRKRDAKRAKLAAALECERAAIREAQAVFEREQAQEQERMKVMTLEETEVLEAFDYLTDAEFEEFVVLAGLTLADVERIREKAAIAALEQVTEDIQATDRVQAATAAAAAIAAEKKETAEVVVVAESIVVETDETKEQIVTAADADIVQQPVQTEVDVVTADVKETPEEQKSESTTAATILAPAAPTLAAPIDHQRKRPITPQHMTSMELLIKNTAVIGDSNLRCYPIIPTTPSASAIAASAAISAAAAAAVSGGLLSQASTVMAALPTHTAINEEEEEEVVEIRSRDVGMPGNRSSVSLLITKGIPHLENHLSSSSSGSTTSSSSSFLSAASSDEDNYEDSIEGSSNDDDQEDDGEYAATATSTTSTTTVTTTTSGNVQIFEFETIVEESDPHPSDNVMYDSDGEELEILDVDQNNNTNTNDPFYGMDEEEASEMRELLGSMTSEERSEFLRLSCQDDNNDAGYLTTSAIATA
ncbi:hypothetical protein EC957_010093 [Mortierella hygrophila]|uniref:Rho-GAP domain-containing protein n=1 Tax=Mortierella hygrophila TaxID=979708 RepID=A0A9P6K8Q5_9FUNG|nr:hypothetical protein EC957_010093 [Mortierella hygrophila]